MRDLEAHWMPGVWLGKPWGSITHQVWTGSKVIDAHAVQRRPRDERWSKEELLKITATPWECEPRAIDEGAAPPVVGGGVAAPSQEVREEPRNLRTGSGRSYRQ